MSGFDSECGTLSLTDAARRLGIGRSLAYTMAHRVDDDGRRWLCQDVPIIQIGSTFRVPVRPLEAVLSGVGTAS